MEKADRARQEGIPSPNRKYPLFFFMVLTLITIFILILLFTPKESSQEQESFRKNPSSSCHVEQNAAAEELKIKKIDYLLKGGDSIFYVLSETNLDSGEIFNIINSTKHTYNLNRVKMGQPLHLSIDDEKNRLIRLEYGIDDARKLIVRRSPDGFDSSIQEVVYEIRLDTARGLINNSFFESAIKSGMSYQVTMDLADIFSGEIDFHTDVRPGDSFRVLYEKKYKEGKLAGCGKILAAEFVSRGNSHFAIFFEDRQEQRDYYDLAGNSLRRQFLRSPLRYRRISSRFTHRRFHPILKVYRPHLGVDYAAPIGTPVVAAARGRITYAGWKGGYGKFIKIKHDRNYATTYGHLSRFARGTRQGRHVKQGQVIGYVGSTGLSTGPHLDYRLLRGKSYINPLKIKTSSLKSIDKKDRKEFDLVWRDMLFQLNKKKSCMLTSYIPGTYHLIP